MKLKIVKVSWVGETLRQCLGIWGVGTRCSLGQALSPIAPRSPQLETKPLCLYVCDLPPLPGGITAQGLGSNH